MQPLSVTTQCIAFSQLYGMAIAPPLPAALLPVKEQSAQFTIARPLRKLPLSDRPIAPPFGAVLPVKVLPLTVMAVWLALTA